MKFYCFLFLGLLCTIARSQAQEKPFVLGLQDEIFSKELSEKRLLNIYLPEGYSKDSAKGFPLIYLLDGSANEDFIHIAGIVQFLKMIGSMPPTIVVGIANIDRKRDFTFPTTIDSDKAAYPTTGHSAAFISFLEKELQPYIERKYKVNNNRAIIGQSLGGLLATEILLEKPALFNQYIIVSPSLWWDAESLLKKAPQLIKTNTPHDVDVYLCAGTEGQQMESDVKRLADLLSTNKKGTSKVFFNPMPDETHLTILHNAIYQALLTLNMKM